MFTFGRGDSNKALVILFVLTALISRVIFKKKDIYHKEVEEGANRVFEVN